MVSKHTPYRKPSQNFMREQVMLCLIMQPYEAGEEGTLPNAMKSH